MIVQLSDEIHKNDIILLLIRCLRYIDFEVIFMYIMYCILCYLVLHHLRDNFIVK